MPMIDVEMHAGGDDSAYHRLLKVHWLTTEILLAIIARDGGSDWPPDDGQRRSAEYVEQVTELVEDGVERKRIEELEAAHRVAVDITERVAERPALDHDLSELNRHSLREAQDAIAPVGDLFGIDVDLPDSGGANG